jgi:methionyl-tRNA formyltransferase
VSSPRVSKPRIVFAGTPAFACPVLYALLHETSLQVVGVYTQPDRPAGRGKQLHLSPVKQMALSNAIAVFQPQTLREPMAQQELRALAPDLMIVAAYGLLLPAAVLAIPPRGCINVHASLLPRWRGAAPIERAIEAGDTQTGITIMQMDEGLDTGPMLLQRPCPIGAADTGESVRERLGVLGAEALMAALALLFTDRLEPMPQDSRQATLAPKLRREESIIDWRCDAAMLARRVRAFNAANVCRTSVSDQPLRVWEAHAESDIASAAPGTIVSATAQGIRVACSSGVLRLTRLQLAGGKAMDAAVMLNGRADLFRPGNRLGLSV